MNDYSKWDNIKDSDDEQEEEAPRSTTLQEEVQETLRESQERVDVWLRRQIAKLEAQTKPKRKKIPSYHQQQAYGQPPELSELSEEVNIPYRKLTADERRVVSMLIAVSHFEEGTTNLDRHPQMLDLMRHHPWLEEDPGTLELLCRVHNQAMKRLKDGDDDEDTIRTLDNPEDQRMRNMIMCGINTLAAPKKCKCTGGLFELVTQICTPTTSEGRERRKKWQTKEYGKDAVFDSLFPDLRQFNDDDADTGWTDFIVFGAVLVLLIAICLFLVYGGVFNKSAAKGAAKVLTTTLAPVVAPEAAAATAASAMEGRESEL